MTVTRDFIAHAEGSVLITVGRTRVICTATVEEKTPPFLKGKGEGWVTAEYGMLPRSTGDRNPREAARGKQGGRTMEIQRLIGRSLRSVVDLPALGERTVLIDCDVIEADGGTRTASITGAYIALADALDGLRRRQVIAGLPLTDFLAATSAGVIEGTAMLDLAYVEDSRADVDLNMVMTGQGGLVEVQGTGESGPFSRAQLDELLELAQGGISHLIGIQKGVLGTVALEVEANVRRAAGDR